MKTSAALGFFDITVCRLNKTQKDILYVLTHVTGFGQRGGIGNRKRHVQNTRQRLRQCRFTNAGRTEQQHVTLADIRVFRRMVENTLIVVIHRHRQRYLGAILTDHVFIQFGFDLLRGRQARRLVLLLHRLVLYLVITFVQDLVAQHNAFVADIYPGTHRFPRGEAGTAVRR